MWDAGNGIPLFSTLSLTRTNTLCGYDEHEEREQVVEEAILEDEQQEAPAEQPSEEPAIQFVVIDPSQLFNQMFQREAIPA